MWEGREFRDLNGKGVAVQCTFHTFEEQCWKDVTFGKYAELDQAEACRRLLLWEQDVFTDDGGVVDPVAHNKRGGRLLCWYK